MTALRLCSCTGSRSTLACGTTRCLRSRTSQGWSATTSADSAARPATPIPPYSHADDLWRLLDHLEIDNAVLVGLSMGGRIVLEATLAEPERVRALVLLDAVLDGVPWDPDSERGIQAIGEGLRFGGLDEAKAAWLRHDFFVPAQRTPDVARRLAEMVGDYSGVNWTSADPHAPHPNSIELLATIAAPTTVVIAELDVPCFHEMSDILANRIADARKVTVPGVGHMVNMEAPEAVWSRVHRFSASRRGLCALRRSV